MKALDTNVLIRFLVNDDEKQAEIVYKTFKRAEDEKKKFWIPILVILETLWVFESVYKIPRKDILDSIYELTMIPIFKFESLPSIQYFIITARKNKIDLSDLLIACSAKQSECESVLTFDKKAAKFELFEMIRS